MLAKRIFAWNIPVDSLPVRTGVEVATELQGRPLLRYVTYEGVHEQSHTGPTFVCPTAYAPADQVNWLALPRPELVRDYVLLLDPELIPSIKGPRWVSGGGGIEYVLPDGYGPEAVIVPGWAVPIR